MPCLVAIARRRAVLRVYFWSAAASWTKSLLLLLRRHQEAQIFEARKLRSSWYFTKQALKMKWQSSTRRVDHHRELLPVWWA
jgi:hypothetical protein